MGFKRFFTLNLRVMTKSEKTLHEEITGTVDEIIKEVRRLIREGNARSLIIKNKDGKELFKTQLTFGVAGTTIFTVMAPFISALTMLVLFANDVKVVVEKEPTPSSQEDYEEDEYEIDGEIIDITDEDERD